MRCNFLLISLFALFATACEHANTDGKEFEVSGAVQKGPFIVGTPVFVNRLDNKGVASENTVISEIEDSIGTFSFRVSEEGPVQIVANGYFFNELTGQISSGTLVLKAIYNASAENDQKAYVNILTHLINDRVLKLIETGDIQLSDAIETAQLELIGELNPVLPIENISNFNGLSVYNDNAKSELENAYLLALSTAFYKYAELKALNQDTSADAQLSLILNVVSDDFAEDGIIQTPNFINDLTNSLRMLNPVQIAENLKSRSLIDYSEPASVPDISRFFGLCAGDLECDWSSRAPMPVPTRGHASAVYQGSILVFGGTSPNDYDELYDLEPINTAYTGTYKYSPDSNEWSVMSSMPIGLYDLTAHTIGNKVYIFGGYGAGGFNNAVMEYDVINDSWSLKEPMPTYRYLFQSEVIDNLVYVIGGQGTIDDGPWESGKEWEYKSHVEIYNPVLDSWSTGTPAPRNLATGASCSLYDDIYIFGGNNGSIQSTAFAYNVVSDSWRELSGSSVAREGHECIEQGDNFYLLGGRNSTGALNLLETYSTVTNLWADEGYIPSARYWFSAALYESSIYLFGGKDSSNTDTNSVVVYKLSGS